MIKFINIDIKNNYPLHKSFLFGVLEFLPNILHLLCNFQCVLDVMRYPLCNIIHFLPKFIAYIMKCLIIVFSKFLLFSLSSFSLLLLVLSSCLGLLLFYFLCIMFYIFFGILCRFHPFSELSFRFLCGWKIPHIFSLLLTMKIVHELLSKIHIIPSFGFLITSILTFLTRRSTIIRTLVIIVVWSLVWSWWACWFSNLIVLLLDRRVWKYLISLIDLFK